MEETERIDGFSRDDTEEFNEAWKHGVITGIVHKNCIFGFLCKKHNTSMYFVFDLCYVYTNQLCHLYNSAIPQRYPKIKKCLYNSAVSFR